MFDRNVQKIALFARYTIVFVCLSVSIGQFVIMKKQIKSSVASVAKNAQSVKTINAEIQNPSVPSVASVSVKTKSPQLFDGCMTGRMSMFRDCVKQNKTHAETLEILRAKYPYGLSGQNAIKWIEKHYARISAKLNASPSVAIASPSPSVAKTDASPKTSARPKTSAKRKTSAKIKNGTLQNA